MFYDDDADLHKLDGKTVAIIGYGSQGHAHALNLKDSGVDVVVGLRPGSASRAKAESHGLRVLDPLEAASAGDVVMIKGSNGSRMGPLAAALREHFSPVLPGVGR